MAKPLRESFVYGLCEPGTHGEVRYVGKTVVGMLRFQQHAADTSHTHRGRWLAGLRARSQEFGVVIFERCAPEELSARERYWVRWCRKKGFRLMNLTDGGEGTYGRKHTAETKAKIAAAHRGRKRGPDFAKKISPIRKQMWADPAFRERASSRMLGKKYHLGFKHSPEARAKMSAVCTSLRRSRPEITPRGETHPCAKLTETEVREIRAAYAAGEKQCVLAKRYGIKCPALNSIVHRKTWRHVD